MFDDLAKQCDREVDGDTELWAESELERSLEWDGDVLKTSETSQDSGAMLRLVNDGSIGSAYANADELSSDYLIDNARDTARFLEPDEHRGLSESEAEDIYTDRWFDGTVEGSIDSRRASIESALADGLDRDGIRTLQVTLSESKHRTHLYREGEPLVEQLRSRYSFSVWAVCERDGEVETGFDVQSSWQWPDLDFDDVIGRAIDRGKRQLGAEPAEGYKGTILLTNHAATTLMRLVRQVLDGESVVKGRSAWSQDRVGETVAGDNITIVDDPERSGGAGNLEYDAEGHETERVSLVENGVYRQFLTNQYVASRADVDNVNRASRSFKSRPEIGHTNLYIEPGKESFSTLEEQLSDGPVVTGIQPGSGLDAVAGHLSVGAKGYYRSADGGRQPFSEGTLSGSLETFLKNIVKLGDTLPPGRRLASPALLVEDLTLGGAS